MKTIFRISFLVIVFVAAFLSGSANNSQREKTLFDNAWKFAYGHPTDAAKDFTHGTSYFSFYAKAGYGDGPAAASFDDRAWRVLDLPHDWVVEQPFDAKGSHSH